MEPLERSRVRGLLGCVILLSAVLPLSAQSGLVPDVSPETLLLARIREHMSSYLTRQPDYTCLETIERSQRLAPSRRFQVLDTLRLEVAVVDGTEMLAWPGASQFEDRELRDWAPTGAMSIGAFFSHAQSIFLSRAPYFTYRGEEEVDGQRLVRYDFSVSQHASGLSLRQGYAQAVVAYHGSFWADPETLDTYRLRIVADDNPPDLYIESAGTTIDYGRANIGGREFLLPSRAVTYTANTDGNESQNETVYSGCRQYTGESVLSFAEPAAEVAPPPAPPEIIELPEGLRMELALQTPIDDTTSFVGDPIEAEVVSEVKRRGEVLIPEGARVTGRLMHLRRIVGRQEYFQVAIRFDALAFGNKRAEFHAELDRFTTPFPRLRQVSMRPDFPGLNRWANSQLEAPPGVSVFYVRGGQVRLEHGTRMVWLTTPPSVPQ